MTTQYIYNMVDTWNDGATTFTAVKMNVTDTASNAASLLMDLQVGTVSKFKVAKDGSVVLPASASGYALWGGLPTSTGYYAASLGEQSIYSAGSKMIGIHSGSSFVVFNSRIGFSTTANYNSQDLVLTRRAAANLQLGDANAAAPVAQTLSVQSVVAGTSNTAGANLTITGSQGTGNAAGGSIIFQVAPLGSSGTAQNALATALTIASNKSATFEGLIIVPDSQGVYAAGGSVRFGVSNTTFLFVSGSEIRVPNYGIKFSADGGITSPEFSLLRDAANTLALRNGTNAQRFNVYNTYTSSTNYEAFKIDWITTANTVLVGTEKGSGGGTARALEFQTDGTTRLTIAAAAGTITGAVFKATQYFDAPAGALGTSAGIYLGTAGASGSQIQSTAAGVIALGNYGGTDFGRLQFGGTTSSFPALKRSSTTLQARLADDSAFASVQGKLTTDTAYTAGAPTATGYLVLYDSNGTAYRVPAVLN